MDSWTNGPGTNPYFYETWKITPSFRLLKQQVIGSVGSVLWLEMATVGLVMLIACTNVANLLLVRADGRQQDLSIRAALGAGRGRIARELLIESALLGLMGGVLAVGVAYAGLRLLVAIGPADLPRLSEISLDARSLGFTFVLSVISGLLFGSIPAWKYARARAAAVIPGASRTASVGRDRQRSRNFLVVSQVAMALVLLVSALLMIRTFVALRNVEPGFTDAAHLQTMRIWIPDNLVANPQMVTRIQNDIADKLAAIPGVSSVGFAGAVPMEGIDPNWDQIRVEGKDYGGDDPPLRLFDFVSPGYFKTVGTRLVAGRDMTWTDIYGLRPVVMVSENFARESWGSASAAVGKRVRQFSSMPWVEVIGVVQDVRHNGVDEGAPAIVYWPAMIKSPYTPQPTIVPPRSVMTFAIRSARAGNESFRSAASGMVGERKPAPGFSANDAGDLQRIAGAEFVHAGDACDCRLDGVAAGHPRHLRRDLLRRIAAHPRARHPFGARRTEGRPQVDVRPFRTAAYGGWSSDRYGHGSGTDAVDEVAPVWHQSA